jgi:hypothetical protein
MKSSTSFDDKIYVGMIDVRDYECERLKKSITATTRVVSSRDAQRILASMDMGNSENMWLVKRIYGAELE